MAPLNYWMCHLEPDNYLYLNLCLWETENNTPSTLIHYIYPTNGAVLCYFSLEYLAIISILYYKSDLHPHGRIKVPLEFANTYTFFFKETAIL